MRFSFLTLQRGNAVLDA
ncbi:DUF1534 domain-containing protein, partial [Pseudomonas syringae pv. actinidiae]|nr:DUF1534 domain-containing protein [Pseudomonas syringae pv. actinidiae]NVL43422.1 DUF1534 domain-containing protein [Pseudomonas syringae pv. actinidiae]